MQEKSCVGGAAIGWGAARPRSLRRRTRRVASHFGGPATSSAAGTGRPAPHPMAARRAGDGRNGLRTTLPARRPTRRHRGKRAWRPALGPAPPIGAAFSVGGGLTRSGGMVVGGPGSVDAAVIVDSSAGRTRPVAPVASTALARRRHERWRRRGGSGERGPGIVERGSSGPSEPGDSVFFLQSPRGDHTLNQFLSSGEIFRHE